MKKLLSLTAILVTLLSAPAAVNAGTATYYSNSLQGKIKANGRPYNKQALTAAYNRAPLGSKLKVTNRKTGKSVIVKVTDRCNCSIDLSYAAFGRIAKHKQGRVPVTITRIK